MNMLRLTLPSWMTNTIYVIAAVGMVAPPFLQALIPDPQTRAGVQLFFAAVGALNAKITSISNPDGTPVQAPYIAQKEMTTK